MSRRSRVSTGAKARRSKRRKTYGSRSNKQQYSRKSEVIQTSGGLRRVRSDPASSRVGATSVAVLHGKPQRKVSRDVGVRKSTDSPRQARNRLSTQRRDRRDPLQSQRRLVKGLSPMVLPERKPHANATSKSSRQSLCARKAKARRAVIIATGYGGINGVRTYKRRNQTCR